GSGQSVALIRESMSAAFTVNSPPAGCSTVARICCSAANFICSI
ncbi:hypothetical protein D030_5129B, partial [Vibrio parahaemolyticus AQ3810]